MKRIAHTIISLLLSQLIFAQQEKDSFYALSPVEVKAIRLGENAPFAKTNIGKKEISKLNLGQDVPFILNRTPSVVINADAGNGVGYTGFRIRGSDAARINVTLNGIPLNDAESQGSFFIDLPDFTSSTNSIQIQRGVGTSSNGAGAFGGSINFSTNEVNKESYAELNNSYGSFNTWKNTFKAGTGLLNNHFTVDVRASSIRSDGYIDRASSNLKSIFFSGAYIDSNSSLRFNYFTGKEKTYQAWNGVLETDLKSDKRTYNSAGTDKPGNPYDNETDNYIQTHHQFFFDHKFNKEVSFNLAFFLTKGKGYYEQYRADESYADYGLSIANNSDIIRQLWLDNDYYGSVFSILHKAERLQTAIGGAITFYDGRHFGDLIWASNGLPTPKHRWYNLKADKNDYSFYVKENIMLHKNIDLFADVQFRHVDYFINGFRKKPTLQAKSRFNFLNPKLGVSFHKNGWKSFLSFAVANKEPNRDDFEAGASRQPKPERLYDWELGIEKSNSQYSLSATFYYMDYKDQLTLTGQINDVGGVTRINVPKSYRLGVELQGDIRLNDQLNAGANLTLSQNKVKKFTEYVDSYDADFNWIASVPMEHKNTDIAFSPSLIGGYHISYSPVKQLELSLLGKYVGQQYLDNTENKRRSLNSFFVQDVRGIISFDNKIFKQWRIIGQINNIFSKKYEPNGWTYPYLYDGKLTADNGYYPMAERNFMLALNISF